MINRIIKTKAPLPALLPLSAAVASCLRRNAQSAVSISGLSFLLAAPGITSAATFQVMNSNDSGPGSLRQAVLDANTNYGADDIVFDATVSGKVKLVSGALLIMDSVEIIGPGADSLALDAGGSSEIFVVSDAPSGSSVELTVSGLTLTNATTAITSQARSSDTGVTVVDSILSRNLESAIVISDLNSSANLTVRGSELSENGADAIHFTGDYGTPEFRASIEDVTISQNGGEGIYCGINVVAELTGSEIKGNVENGIAIEERSSLTLKNSSVLENGANGIQALGNNIHAEIRASTISGNRYDGVKLDIYRYYDSHEFGSYRSRIIITDSTLSSSVHGAGVRFYGAASSAEIRNSTITGNANVGVYAYSNYDEHAINIENSIVAGNVDGDLVGGIPFTVHHSLVQDVGYAKVVEPVPDSNIIGEDALLGPLQNNGGPTPTHALNNGSPAIDGGDNATCSKTDQRGVVRPQDGNGDNLATCDMGAVEQTTGSGVIGDRVWLDEDGDGVQDAEEQGFAGAEVRLQVDCGRGALLTTVTDESGAFSFTGLPVGKYQLEFVKPAGYEFSPAIAAGNFRIDSNANPANGLDRCRSLKPGQRRLALDAGLVPGN